MSNLSNTSVKRIMTEAKELREWPSDDVRAAVVSVGIVPLARPDQSSLNHALRVPLPTVRRGAPRGEPL